MTDRIKLQQVLINQSPKGIKSQDWQDIRGFETTANEQGGIDVRIPSLSIGFVFDKKDRFVGIYNWKE